MTNFSSFIVPLISQLTPISEAASTYNSKFSKTIQQIIDEIQQRKDWIGVDWVEDSTDDEDESSPPKRTVKLLDYACGTGLVSRVCTLHRLPCPKTDNECRLLRHTLPNA
jgi:hypothetical protein